jgi:hypothetical protein
MSCSAVKQRCGFRPHPQAQRHRPGVRLEIVQLSTGEDRQEVCNELRRRISHKTRALLLVSPSDLAKGLAAMLSELRPVLVKAETRQACRFGVAGIDRLVDGSLPSGWDLFFLVGPLRGGMGSVTNALSRVALPGRVPVIRFESRSAPP